MASRRTPLPSRLVGHRLRRLKAHDAVRPNVPRTPSKSGNGQVAKRTQSSSDVVLQTIIRGLYDGRYVPGQRLIEADLIREFGVSRGCIREALSRLAAEGIVTSNLYRGAYIRALSRVEARSMLEVMEVLVGLAARLAAERIDTADHRQRLRDALAQCLASETGGDSLQAVRARNHFYRTLLAMGQNAELARILPSLSMHFIRSQSRVHRTTSESKRLDDYREIAEAVLATDARLAERMARQHVRRMIEAIEALPDDVFAAALGVR